MRRWVTHLPHDLRPRRFLFAPLLQMLHPEVDQEVKQESFKEPSFAMFCLVHWLLCEWSVSEHIVCLCTCSIQVSIIIQLPLCTVVNRCIGTVVYIAGDENFIFMTCFFWAGSN